MSFFFLAPCCPLYIKRPYAPFLLIIFFRWLLQYLRRQVTDNSYEQSKRYIYASFLSLSIFKIGYAIPLFFIWNYPFPIPFMLSSNTCAMNTVFVCKYLPNSRLGSCISLYTHSRFTFCIQFGALLIFPAK